MHLETTGETAGINKEKKTEANLACSCCEQFQHDGFVFRRICSFVLQKALAPTDFFFKKQQRVFFISYKVFIIYHGSSLEIKPTMSFRTNSG